LCSRSRKPTTRLPASVKAASPAPPCSCHSSFPRACGRPPSTAPKLSRTLAGSLSLRLIAGGHPSPESDSHILLWNLIEGGTANGLFGVLSLTHANQTAHHADLMM